MIGVEVDVQARNIGEDPPFVFRVLEVGQTSYEVLLAELYAQRKIVVIFFGFSKVLGPYLLCVLEVSKGPAEFKKVPGGWSDRFAPILAPN